ncbi:1855_t:CDS:2, partial [Diversispora eburnea]
MDKDNNNNKKEFDEQAVSITPSTLVTLSSPTKTDGKAERRKKFRSWRVQSNSDDGAVASLNEAWNFTGGRIKKLENAKFLQANILDGLPFLDDTFDFVNMRLLITAFTITEWEQKVIPELIRVTRGGGWIEFMESDIQYHNQGPTTEKLTNAVKTFMKSKGIISPIDIHTTQSMEANDKFVTGIQTKEMSCFVGHWARELGQFAVDDINKGWNAIRTPMSTLMKVKSHEYDEIVATFAKEVEQYKTYFKTWRFY